MFEPYFGVIFFELYLDKDVVIVMERDVTIVKERDVAVIKKNFQITDIKGCLPAKKFSMSDSLNGIVNVLISSVG